MTDLIETQPSHQLSEIKKAARSRFAEFKKNQLKTGGAAEGGDVLFAPNGAVVALDTGSADSGPAPAAAATSRPSPSTSQRSKSTSSAPRPSPVSKSPASRRPPPKKRLIQMRGGEEIVRTIRSHSCYPLPSARSSSASSAASEHSATGKSMSREQHRQSLRAAMKEGRQKKKGLWFFF